MVLTSSPVCLNGPFGPLISISIHLAFASASQASMTQHLLMGTNKPNGYKDEGRAALCQQGWKIVIWKVEKVIIFQHIVKKTMNIYSSMSQGCGVL